MRICGPARSVEPSRPWATDCSGTVSAPARARYAEAMRFLGPLRQVMANRSLRKLEAVTGSSHSATAADMLMTRRLAELGQ